MSDDADSKGNEDQSPGESTSPAVRRRPGNPAWQPGVSGNPAGRKKVGLTLAEVIRNTVDPAECASILMEIARDRCELGSARVAAIGQLYDRGYGKAAQVIELVAPSTGFDVSRLTVDELELFERIAAKAVVEAAKSDAEVIDVESTEDP